MTIHASVHGRAARDGELRESKSGTHWSRLSVACQVGIDAEGDALVQWITVIAFNRQAESLSRVAKGETVSAIGRVQLNRWTDKQGEIHNDLQLIAEAVLTARSARPGQHRRKAQTTERETVPFNDELTFNE